jgi:hypothetical protein
MTCGMSGGDRWRRAHKGPPHGWRQLWAAVAQRLAATCAAAGSRAAQAVLAAVVWACLLAGAIDKRASCCVFPLPTWAPLGRMLHLALMVMDGMTM